MSDSTEANAAAQEAAADSTPPLVVVDLGKQKSGRIKKLRKGEGKLMACVQEVIDELRSNGTVAGDAQPVVILVERKDKPPFPLSGVLG